MGKHTIARFAFLVVVALTVGSSLSGRAAVVPVAPAGGEVFQLLPEKQRKVLAGKTRVERQQVLKGLDALATRNSWRRQRPLVLKWKTTAGEDGPWRIRLAEKSDLSDARELWLEKDWAKKGAKDTSGAEVSAWRIRSTDAARSISTRGLRGTASRATRFGAGSSFTCSTAA